MELGPVPVRLNPESEAEVLWCKRIDPARAIVWNVPLPESGHRCGDLVLHDGAPVGARIRNGVEVPVFDELVLLQPSSLGTFVATINGLSQSEAEQLVEQAAERNMEAEDWSSKVQYLCRACSEGTIDHSHQESMERPERRFGFAASSATDVRAVIESVVALSGAATLEGIECAIAPTPIQ